MGLNMDNLPVNNSLDVKDLPDIATHCTVNFPRVEEIQHQASDVGVLEATAEASNLIVPLEVNGGVLGPIENQSNEFKDDEPSLDSQVTKMAEERNFLKEPTAYPSSLSYLLSYGSEASSTDSDSDCVEVISDTKSSNKIKNTSTYRESKCSGLDDSSDSDVSVDDGIDIEPAARSTAKKAFRSETELELDELPPVPDLSTLSLDVNTEDCIKMGKVVNIIDRLVTVDSLPFTPAYDLDTLLFLDQGKMPLGYVHDVIGQVTAPIYVIRFNSKEEIESRGITKGLPVYSAPRTKHTQFVFIKQLLQMKGSDASWQGDLEVPQEFADFSDDEMEVPKRHVPNSNFVPSHKRKRNNLDRQRFKQTWGPKMM